MGIELEERRGRVRTIPESLLAVFAADYPWALLTFNGQGHLVHHQGLASLPSLHLAENELGEPIRFGNLMRCAQSGREQGCGGQQACRTCEARVALERGTSGAYASTVCHITCADGTTLSLDVIARPIPERDQVDGAVTMMWIKDATDHLNREALEATFLHDVLNEMVGLRAFLEMILGEQSIELSAEEKRTILIQSERLYLDIVAHRDLSLASRGSLATDPKLYDICRLAEEAKSLFQFDPRLRNRKLEISWNPHSCDCPPVTIDKRIAMRVIINMISNALESTPEGETARIGLAYDMQFVRLSVHNVMMIPEQVQPRIFQRFYSTKGKGRGLGTYSMKLLAESYLGGKIDFVTAQKSGTTFTLSLPTARSLVEGEV